MNNVGTNVRVKDYQYGYNKNSAEVDSDLEADEDQISEENMASSALTKTLKITSDSPRRYRKKKEPIIKVEQSEQARDMHTKLPSVKPFDC